jgi:hypothetical protein
MIRAVPCPMHPSLRPGSRTCLRARLRSCLRWSSVPLAVALVMGCAGGPRLPDGLDLIVQPIDTTTTLASWLSGHKSDSVIFRAPAGSANDYICRTAEAQVPVAGHPMTRSAVFYIPDAPDGEVFPADTASFERRACRQRGTWLEREVTDSAQASAFADTLEKVLGTRLGAGRPTAEIAGVGTGAWRHTRTWDTASTHIVLGVEASTYHDEDTPKVTRHRSRVIVAAYAPKSGLAPGEARLESGGYTRAHFPLHGDIGLQRERADSALRLSGVATIATDLKRVFAHAEAHAEAHSGVRMHTDSLHVPAIDAAIVRAATATRDTAHTLAPSRRAATLLATDLAIAAYADVLDADTLSADWTTRLRLESVGVDYAPDKRGSTYQYLRAWLWEAYRTDSLGPAGKLAFVELSSNAWSTKPSCADGAAGYDRIIEHGEAALKRGDTDPMIHFYMGEAYRDIYSLAHGGGEGHVDEKLFAPRAEEARQKGIEHLTAALKALTQHPMRHAAWDDAVRLLLRVHTEPSFYCVY